MRRNRISSNPEVESSESSSKRTALLIAYFFWLKIAGLHDFSNQKTDSICKTNKRIIFKILLAFNALFHICIVTFCLFTAIIIPKKLEESVLSFVTLIACAMSAIGRVILFIYLKKYLPPLSDHLFRSLSKQSKPEDLQPKCPHFNFRWPVFVLVFPLTVIVLLFVSGIANAVLSDWESQSYILIKLSLHVLILQAIIQQVAILFLLIGSCYYCWRLLKSICESIKNFSGLNGEHLGLSIRSFCDEYSDFIVLMDEFSNMMTPVIVILIPSLCVSFSIIFLYDQIDIFENSELGIVFILGVCALIIIIVTRYTLLDVKDECKLYLISVKLDHVLDEFKIDFSGTVAPFLSTVVFLVVPRSISRAFRYNSFTHDCLKMIRRRIESACKDYGTFINLFNSQTKKIVRRIEKIKKALHFPRTNFPTVYSISGYSKDVANIIIGLCGVRIEPTVW